MPEEKLLSRIKKKHLNLLFISSLINLPLDLPKHSRTTASKYLKRRLAGKCK